MKKILVLFTCIISSVLFVKNVQAASFEDMKKNVENGEGLVYNPVSEGMMTHESSLEYVNKLDDKLDDSSKITEEIMNNVYEETKDLEIIPGSKTNTNSISPRGAYPPSSNSVIYLDNYPGGKYVSEGFSGRGWRYGGYYFTFRNLSANPYFGVAASGDSFDFRDAYGGYNSVYATGAYSYYPSYIRGGGSGTMGLFRSFNPVSGSKYYIY